MNILAYRISLSFYNLEIKGFSYIFSIFPILIIFLYLLIPFKIFIYKLRFGVLLQTLKCFFPFQKGGVAFREYISCDILTSVIYPFVSLTVAFCMFFCEDCKNLEIRNKCVRENGVALTIQILPYFASAIHCLNKMYYTQKKILFTINFVKFFFVIGFILISYFTKTSNFFKFLLILIVFKFF